MNIKKSPVIIVLGLLTAFCIFVELYCFITKFCVAGAISLVVSLAIYGLIFYYALKGYKKPHGNLLRILFLGFSVCGVLGALFAVLWSAWSSSNEAFAFGVTRCIALLLIAYMGGRLYRIKTNLRVAVLVTILMVVSSIINIHIGIPAFITFAWAFTYLIMWLDLCAAYILRYREHKEAGLLDENDPVQK